MTGGVWDVVLACPDCYRACGWCAWFAMNAREAGCGSGVTSGFGYRAKRRCEWEALKGTVCPRCNGHGKVRVVGRFEAVGS